MTLDITTGQAPLSAEERNRLYARCVAPHYRTIMTAVHRQTFAGEDADDNLQEVLITLLQNVASIAALPPAQQLPWMLCIVRNKMTDIHRHARSLASIYGDGEGDPLPHDPDHDGGDDGDDDGSGMRCYDDEGGSHRSPQVTAGLHAAAGLSVPATEASSGCSTPPLTIDREDYPRTYDALMSLPALQRRAILLAAEGWKPTDIMAELQLPATTVYPLLSRARTFLRSHTHFLPPPACARGE